MPRHLGVIPLALLAACQQVAPAGDLFAPVQPASTRVAAPAPVEDDPALDGIFDERDDLDAESEPVSPDRLAAGLGLGPMVSAPEPAPAPAPSALPTHPSPPSVLFIQPPAWTPDIPMEGSFGVRLVSTVVDAQPPRAILGLPSGEEEVVQPGTLLPEVGVVVLAIGRDVVQVAEIVPAGDHAKVETRLLTSLYPGSFSAPVGP